MRLLKDCLTCARALRPFRAGLPFRLPFQHRRQPCLQAPEGMQSLFPLAGASRCPEQGLDIRDVGGRQERCQKRGASFQHVQVRAGGGAASIHGHLRACNVVWMRNCVGGVMMIASPTSSFFLRLRSYKAAKAIWAQHVFVSSNDTVAHAQVAWSIKAQILWKEKSIFVVAKKHKYHGTFVPLFLVSGGRQQGPHSALSFLPILTFSFLSCLLVLFLFFIRLLLSGRVLVVHFFLTSFFKRINSRFLTAVLCGYLCIC